MLLYEIAFVYHKSKQEAKMGWFFKSEAEKIAIRELREEAASRNRSSGPTSDEIQRAKDKLTMSKCAYWERHERRPTENGIEDDRMNPYAKI